MNIRLLTTFERNYTELGDGHDGDSNEFNYNPQPKDVLTIMNYKYVRNAKIPISDRHNRNRKINCTSVRGISYASFLNVSGK